MKLSIIAAVAVIAAAVAVTASCNMKQDKSQQAEKDYKDSVIKRGEYLVTIAGCDDCHSPKNFGPNGPELDMEHRFSGYPASRQLPKYDSNVVKQGQVIMNGDLTSAAGPWGASFAANITSDETGIGNWTEQNFFKAIKEGKSKGLDGTRPILPPMPWMNLSHLTDDDIRAIFLFLKSTKPVKNVVPFARPLAALK